MQSVLQSVGNGMLEKIIDRPITVAVISLSIGVMMLLIVGTVFGLEWVGADRKALTRSPAAWTRGPALQPNGNSRSVEVRDWESSHSFSCLQPPVELESKGKIGMQGVLESEAKVARAARRIRELISRC